MNLASAFAASVEKRREKIVLYWGENEFSYAAIFAQACVVAAELAGKLGVKPGDRVALWMKNCPEFVPAVFGVLSAGGVVVPINNFLKPAEVSYILNDSGANVMITDAELSAHFPELAAARPPLKMLKVEEFAGQGPTESHPTGPRVHRSQANWWLRKSIRSLSPRCQGRLARSGQRWYRPARPVS